MEKYELIRQKLDKKIFTPYGIDASYKTRTPVLNDWGEIESYTEVTSTVKMVPYDITKNAFDFTRFSLKDNGEFEMAVKYDEVLKTHDIIELASEEYLITEILPNYLKENVVNIVRLKKKLN